MGTRFAHFVPFPPFFLAIALRADVTATAAIDKRWPLFLMASHKAKKRTKGA